MMVKKNQPNSYDEILTQFSAIKAEQERIKTDPICQTMFPEYLKKYVRSSEPKSWNDRACTSRAMTLANAQT